MTGAALAANTWRSTVPELWGKAYNETLGWGVEKTYISEDPGGKAFSYPENKTAGSELGDLRRDSRFLDQTNLDSIHCQAT